MSAKVGRQGADINFTQPKSIEHNNQENTSLLMFACKASHIKIVEMLLDCEGIRIFQKDRLNRNAVHYAFQNKSEKESKFIVLLLFERYPQLVTNLGFLEITWSLSKWELHKTQLLQLIIHEQIQADYLKDQGKLVQNLALIFHQTMKMHRSHKNLETTLSLLKILVAAGCKQDLLNEKAENYIHYALSERIMNENQINEMLKQLKSQPFQKQLTLETSPEQKLVDSHQDSEEYQQNSSFSENEGEIQISSHDSPAYEPNHAQISEEMNKIAFQVVQAHQHTWVTLYPFYLKIDQIVASLYGTTEVIGSFASKLWIPNCDIDFLLIIPEQNPDLFGEIVQNIFYRVKKLNCHYHIRYSLAYKLPMIKLILLKQFGNLEVELFLSNKKNIATQYVSFIHEVLAFYPEIQVIYSVIRKLLEVKSLHDHKNGGLKAYGLFLLIYSMRYQYHYPYVSQFLEHFAYYYGIAYEYAGELVEGEIAYKINIIDPLNSENNMGGKKTDILNLQELFKKIYYGINMENEGSKITFLTEVIKDI